MNKQELLNLINRENLDAKNAKLKDNSQYKNEQGVIYFSQIVIIKTGAGRTLFNESMKLLYPEDFSKTQLIPQSVQYPYYILEIDETVAGCVGIIRKQYQDLKDLEKVVEIDRESDNFDNFKHEYTQIINEEMKKFYGLKTKGEE